MRDDRAYLQHIRDAIDDVKGYASAGRAAFFDERMRQDATLRKLEVIGQAVKNLSGAMKSRQPDVPPQRHNAPPAARHDQHGQRERHRLAQP